MWEFVPGREYFPSLLKLHGLIKLARPIICSLGFAGVYLGYWLTTRTFDISNMQCLIGGVVAALAMAYGNTINDVLDHKIDAIVTPFRPIPAGIVTPRDGLFSGGIIAAFTLLLGSTLGKEILLLVLVGLLFVTLYDLWAKAVQWIGNLLIAGISIVPGIIGNLIADQGDLPISLLAAFMLFVLAREIYRTIHDGPGDLVAGRRTIFLSLGKGKTQIIAFLLGLVGTTVLMLFPLHNKVRYVSIYSANVILIFILLLAVGALISYYQARESTPPYYDLFLTILMRSVFCLACISLLWII